MDDLDMFDISEVTANEEVLTMELPSIKNEDTSIVEHQKKDKFMIGIYVSLIVLVLLTTIIYFFGYELFKPIIKV